ncbi:MAG: protein-L-isoaspartate(D-aspartate) O-methyltransferase [Phycisphaerae bacterium]
MQSQPNLALPADMRLAERERMIAEQIIRRGVRDERVLSAMRSVPREHFVRADLADRAYEDSALPIECAQTISQPYIVARMTELLAPQPGSRLLEIGSGSGYQSAVLSQLVSRVYAIEWHLPLVTLAIARLEQLGVGNVTLRCGDGSVGWPACAPFDGILVAAGGPEVPNVLREQLTIGGRLVMPIGPLDRQVLVLVERVGPGDFRHTNMLDCRFVRLVGEAGWPSN